MYKNPKNLKCIFHMEQIFPCGNYVCLALLQQASIRLLRLPNTKEVLVTSCNIVILCILTLRIAAFQVKFVWKRFLGWELFISCIVAAGTRLMTLLSTAGEVLLATFSEIHFFLELGKIGFMHIYVHFPGPIPAPWYFQTLIFIPVF
ncbi:unnamed protein product [Meganyctiphanes norvegica]|uniref:Uncharacterized protein n=1 Tax=Meganyctiphanes norvegica TaxID=48144 RepID=A0AAV2PN69_MEGNR